MKVGTRYMGRINRPLTNEAAKKLMALDVQDKEILTYEKLDEWYTAWGGQCYVSFSGGKDSTVLAYLAARYLASFRTPPWEQNLVFVNTGLEYPETQKFVNEYAAWLRREFPRVTVNLVRLRPKMNIPAARWPLTWCGLVCWRLGTSALTAGNSSERRWTNWRRKWRNENLHSWKDHGKPEL